MVVRVIKNEVRATMRKANFEHPLSEEPARRGLVPILNRLMASSEESAVYWVRRYLALRNAADLPTPPPADGTQGAHLCDVRGRAQ